MKSESLGDKVKVIADIFGFDLETDLQQVGKFMLQNPRVLTCSKEAIRSTANWFRTCLPDSDDKWIRTYMLKNGRFLGSDIKTLEKKRQWLKGRLELDETQIAQIVRYSPDLLTRSIDDSLEPSVQWIEKRFDLREKKSVGAVICKHPPILGYSVETNLESKIAFFTTNSWVVMSARLSPCWLALRRTLRTV